MPVARIVVGVTGGIAAYKACELVRLLVRAGHEITPVLTRGAQRFVAAETFWALARRPAPADPYPHLQDADALVVAPLTANTLARLAHGLADDLLTETALAHRGPLVVAPAMNTAMWEHPATRANLALLVERGAWSWGPARGELAEGLVGHRADGRARGNRRARRGAVAGAPGKRIARGPPRARDSGRGHGSRSTASGTSGTARRDGWASRSRRGARSAGLA